MGKQLFFVLILNFLFFSGRAQNIYIKIKDRQIKPGTGENIVPVLKKIFEEHKGNQAMVLEFEPGRYDFRPMKNESDNITNGFEMVGKKNITIKGNGATFIFHGKMRPFLINHSSNVRLENLSIDWDRPWISQGELVKVDSNYLDLKIDSLQYPYKIHNEKLAFIGEGWQSSLTSPFQNLHSLYDKHTREILYRTRDNPLGNIFLGPAKLISKNTVRFYGKSSMLPPEGTFVTIYHGRYITPGIEITYSKDITLKNVTIYHALSHGILGEKSKHISIINSSISINRAKDRVFSIIADASHFVNCKGQILVDGCAHSGMGDDFINVHGQYSKVIKQEGSNSLWMEARGRAALRLADIGDQMYFIDSTSMQRLPKLARIKEIEPKMVEGKIIAYKVTFSKTLPERLPGSLYIENKTWSAALELKNCRILKNHRARGILVTTPRKVVIKNNYFRTAGAAILIEGDLNYWYESGGAKKTVIKNNVFQDCLTSGGEWGEAVIAITPSVIANSKPYHRNIYIRHNTFNHFDRAIIFARSVENLKFKNNQINRTNIFSPFSQHSTFTFDGCTRVDIGGNVMDTYFLEKKLTVRNMKPGSIRSDIKW